MGTGLVEKILSKGLTFFYGDETYTEDEVSKSLFFKETSSGANIAERYEPDYHARMLESAKTKEWIPTPAERKQIIKYGYDEATELFSTSRGKYQILPETAYRYTSFSGDVKDLDKDEVQEKVKDELLTKWHSESGGDLEKTINKWNQGTDYFPTFYEHLKSEKLKKEFDPEGSDYDYATAEKYRIKPDETGHYPSREPTTGLILKGKNHPTWDLTVQGEKEAGYKIEKRGDRYYSIKEEDKSPKPQSSLSDFIIPSAEAAEIRRLGGGGTSWDETKTPLETFKGFIKETAQALSLMPTPTGERGEFWNKLERMNIGEGSKFLGSIKDWQNKMAEKYPYWLGEVPSTQASEDTTTRAFQTVQTIASLGAIGILGANVIQGITQAVQMNKGLKGIENITSNLPKIDKILEGKGIVLPKNITSLEKIKIYANMTKRSPILGDILKTASMRPATTPIPYVVGQMVKFGDQVGKIVNITGNAAQILTAAGQQIPVTLDQLKSVKEAPKVFPKAEEPTPKPSVAPVGEPEVAKPEIEPKIPSQELIPGEVEPSKEIVAEKVLRQEKLLPEEVKAYPDLAKIDERFQELKTKETLLKKGTREAMTPVEIKELTKLTESLGGVVGEPIKRAPIAEKILGIEKPETMTITFKQKLALQERVSRLGFQEGWKEARGEFFKQAKSTKIGTAEIKNTLTNYITAKLSPDDRGRFITQLRDVRTKKGLIKAIDRVDRVWEQGQRQGEVVELKKTINKIDVKTLRPEYQKEISDLLDIDLVKRREGTIRSLARTKEYIVAHPDNNIPPEAMRKLDILERKKVKDLDTEDITLLSNTVKHLKKLHDLKNKLIFGKQYREAKEVVNEAVTNVRRRPQIKADPQSISTKDRPTEVGKVREIFTTESWNPELITEILDKEPKGIIKEVVYKGIDEGTSDMLNFRHEADDYFAKKVEGINITKWSEAFHPKPKDKIDYQTIKLPSGKTITMTKGEQIALYLHSRNDKNLKHLLTGGFSFEKTPTRIHTLTSEDLDAIITLDSDEQKVADTIYDYLNTIQKDKLNEISLELNGWEVATEPDYFHIRTNYLDRRRDELKMQKNFSQRTLEGMGILKERTNASNAIILEDAFVSVYKGIKQSSAYYGLAKPLRNAKMLVNDNKFQKEVIRTYGNHYLRALKGYLQDIEGASYDVTAIERLTLQLINKLDIAVLGLNPWVMAKQPISLTAAATEIDIKYLAKVVKPESTEVMGKWHPQLRDRFKGNVTRELGEIGQIGEVRNFWTHKSGISKKFMAGIRRFDYEAIGRIWKAAKFETNALHPSLTGDDKMKHIGNRTWEIVRLTQPTFSLKDRSAIGRSKNVWLRLATKYSSQRNKNYMMVRRSAEKYNRSEKTLRDKKDLIKALAIVTLIMPAMLWTIDELRNRAYKRKPPKRPLRSTILKYLEYNLGNVYLVGNAFRSLQSKIERGKWAGYDISDVFLSTVNRAVDAVVDMYSTIDQAMSKARYKSGDKKGELKWKTSMKNAINYSLSTIAKLRGIPYDTVKKLVEIPFKKEKKKAPPSAEKLVEDILKPSKKSGLVESLLK